MMYDLAAYQYDLPEELIAQHPIAPKDHSRLMVVDRRSGEISERRFFEIVDLLESGDQFILNNTKVIPARLIGKKKSGARVELLLIRQLEEGVWEALARPARKILVGTQLTFSDTFSCEVIQEGSEGVRILKFRGSRDFWEELKICGEIPLPHYIQRTAKEAKDAVDYQTVYASQPGAVAAPTAGLHFTEELFETLEKKGVGRTEITLHVGLGTFRPVQSEDIRNHVMHKELCYLSKDAAASLNSAPASKRQICVGTTCCRTLESASNDEGILIPGNYDTDLFIYPGYTFKFTKQLLTNFHLPGSTLLMLVSAFAGYDLTMEAYRKAVEMRFRFFSYGDAMLIF